MTVLNEYLFVRPKIKRVYNSVDQNRRLLLLTEDIKSLDVDNFPVQLKEILENSKEDIQTGIWHTYSIFYCFIQTCTEYLLTNVMNLIDQQALLLGLHI